MTPQEKAKELLWKYLPILESWKFYDSNLAKQCALIAVDEIINTEIGETVKGYDYWQEVKNEINKL